MVELHIQSTVEMMQLYLISVAVNVISIRLRSLKSLSVYGLFIRPPGPPLTVICNNGINGINGIISCRKYHFIHLTRVYFTFYYVY